VTRLVVIRKCAVSGSYACPCPCPYTSFSVFFRVAYGHGDEGTVFGFFGFESKQSALETEEAEHRPLWNRRHGHGHAYDPDEN